MTKQERFISLARKRLKRAIDADSHNRSEAVEDLEFINGEQWDARELKRRSVSGRPALRINMLPKYVDQVVGEERQNRPKIKVRPADNNANIHIAKIREGIIANIEYDSNAPTIYDQAFEQMVTSGYGAWRILTRYCDDNPFLQEVYLESVPNPFSVWMDPDAKDPCGADAKWGFLLSNMAVEEFEEMFPGEELPGDMIEVGDGTNMQHWYEENTVMVAEYFVVERQTTTIVQMANGTILKKSDAEKLIQDWEENNKQYMNQMQVKMMAAMDGLDTVPTGGPAMGGPLATGQPPTQQPSLPGIVDPAQDQLPNPIPRPRIVAERDTELPTIKQYIITGDRILGNKDGYKVAGTYIPLILLKGKERNIKGKVYVRSLIRDAKDPQRLINYWNTAAAETIALAPKSPWLGTAKQFKGYENDYALANVENFPMLKYNPDSEAPGPPQRVGAADPPLALFSQIQRAEDNLKSVIGMFNADVGDSMPERTGLAVIQKQKPGDTGTFAFIDNLSRAITHTGKIINAMIPEVYDTERDIRIREFDDSESFVPINTTAGNALELVTNNPDRYSGVDISRIQKEAVSGGINAKFNDIGAGKYDIRITIGPSYATQRQESAENMLRLATAMPQQMALASDLIVKNMDFKDSEELYERFRKTLPEGLVKPRPGDPPPQPKAPPPEVQVQMAKVQLEQEKIKIARVKLENEKLRILNEIQQGGGAIRDTILTILEDLAGGGNVANKDEKGSGKNKSNGNGNGSGTKQQPIMNALMN